MKFRLQILLFSLAIFILTAVGLVVIYVGNRVLIFWLALVYILACSLMSAFAVDFLFGKGKLSVRGFLLLTFAIIVIAATVTHAGWTIITPRWFFSVSTNKPTYTLGEAVQIIASLENLGFITHSFKSSIKDPVVVSITKRPSMRQVWFSPYHFEETEFTLPLQQPLKRTFIWNQTNVHYPEEEIEPGTYYISALIESVTSDTPSWDPIFSAGTKINITTT